MMTTELADRVLAAIRNVVGDAESVGLHEPTFEGRELEYVAETVRSGWVSSVGSYVEDFEQRLGATTGTSAVACVNGTSALQLALRVAGVQSGDVVVMPSLTFVASANAVVHAGALPHFCDVEPVALGLDPSALRSLMSRTFTRSNGGPPTHRLSGRRLGAVMVVHVFGNPADTPGLLEVTDELGVPLVEDAAEALGAVDPAGLPCGSAGLIGALSFNGNKVITTGGGGAVLSTDPGLAARARHLATTGKVPHKWEYWHDEVAWNHRMPNLNAALGCAQLESLPMLLDRKRRLHERYREEFHSLGLALVDGLPAGTSNHWLNALRLPDQITQRAVLEATNAAGVATRPLWTPMHHLPIYQHCDRGPLPVTDAQARTIVNVPSSAHLIPA